MTCYWKAAEGMGDRVGMEDNWEVAWGYIWLRTWTVALKTVGT